MKTYLCRFASKPLKAIEALDLETACKQVAYWFACSCRSTDLCVMTFEQAKAEQASLTTASDTAQAALKAIPGIASGPMGLTPDHVRATAEYKIASKASSVAFQALRAFNGVYVKAFKAELAQERRERDAQRVARA